MDKQKLKKQVLGNHFNWLGEKITVCDKCFKASCWQGTFMCDESRGAKTTQKTRKSLIILDLEHTDYMMTDDQLSAR